MAAASLEPAPSQSHARETSAEPCDPGGQLPKALIPGAGNSQAAAGQPSSTMGTDSPTCGPNRTPFTPPGASGWQPWCSSHTRRSGWKQTRSRRCVGNGSGHSRPPHTLLLPPDGGPCQAALGCHLLQAAYPKLPRQGRLRLLCAHTDLPPDSVPCSSFLAPHSSSLPADLPRGVEACASQVLW